MRENCTSGSEGGGAESNRLFLPLSGCGFPQPREVAQPEVGRCWSGNFAIQTHRYSPRFATLNNKHLEEKLC